MRHRGRVTSFLADTSIWSWAHGGRRPDIRSGWRRAASGTRWSRACRSCSRSSTSREPGSEYESSSTTPSRPSLAAHRQGCAVDERSTCSDRSHTLGHGHHRRAAMDYMIAATAELADAVLWAFDRDMAGHLRAHGPALRARNGRGERGRLGSGAGGARRRDHRRLPPALLRGRDHLEADVLARPAGAEVPARPLGLPGDPRRDTTRPDRRDRHVPRRKRALSGQRLRRARSRADRDDRRPRATRAPATPACHVPHRLVDRADVRRTRSQPCTARDTRDGDPRLRSLPRPRPARARALLAARDARVLSRRRGHEHQRPSRLARVRPGADGGGGGVPRDDRELRDRPVTREAAAHASTPPAI